MNNQKNSNILSVPDYERFICTSNKPVIVIIVASWCGNCQIMAPIIEKLAHTFKDEIRFLNVPVDALEITKINFNSCRSPSFINTSLESIWLLREII